MFALLLASGSQLKLTFLVQTCPDLADSSTTKTPPIDWSDCEVTNCDHANTVLFTGWNTNASNITIVRCTFSSITAGSGISAAVLDLRTSDAIDLSHTNFLSINLRNSAAATWVNINHVTFTDSHLRAITANNNCLQGRLFDLMLSNVEAGSGAVLVAEFAYTYSERITYGGSQVPFFGGLVVNNLTRHKALFLSLPSSYFLIQEARLNGTFRPVPEHVRDVL
jgi:hypothetical protein